VYNDLTGSINIVLLLTGTWKWQNETVKEALHSKCARSAKWQSNWSDWPATDCRLQYTGQTSVLVWSLSRSLAWMPNADLQQSSYQWLAAARGEAARRVYTSVHYCSIIGLPGCVPLSNCDWLTWQHGSDSLWLPCAHSSEQFKIKILSIYSYHSLLSERISIRQE